MRLPGKLGSTTLGDLLGALHRARATGVLELIEAGRVHRVHLDEGLVEDVETTLAVPRLGELLRREGFIAEEALARLIRKLAASGRRAGEILVEDRMVTTMAVRAALRRQLRARLEALFVLRDAFVRFRVARRRGHDDGRVPPLSPREFLHGKARRRARAAKPAPPSLERLRALGVLGLGEDADRTAVQRAFRKLALTVHPDRYPAASTEERARLMRRFAELSQAYHALTA
jgi:hypothetical protein